MKPRMILGAQLALLLVSTGVALAADPTGNYQRDDGMARVRVEACGAAICATDTWIKDAASSEKVGDVLVMNLKPAGGYLLTGTAFDRKRDATYSFSMTVEPNRLITKGCVLAGLVCKEVAWLRQ